MELECDILIPAALEGVLTSENAGDVGARMVAELANGPTTPEADQAIAERGIFLIPDFLANAGGVTCSYFEQVQCNMNYFWEMDEVLGKLDVKMTAAYHDVSGLARRQGWEPSYLMYRHSGHASGDRDRVVGYGSFAMGR